MVSCLRDRRDRRSDVAVLLESLGNVPGELLNHVFVALPAHVDRALRGAGHGYYTIGSAGHESNAAVAMSVQPTDPALLHYRSGAFMAARARRSPGETPIFELAKELEEVAVKDPYFVERKLYPNVDFYSGILYRAMGIPTDMFTVLFAIARTVGWIAQWMEMIEDPLQRIGRPRQLYTGATERAYVPMADR